MKIMLRLCVSVLFILLLAHQASGSFQVLESYLQNSGYDQITDINLIMKISPTETIEPPKSLTLFFYNTQITIPEQSKVKCLQRQLTNQNSQKYRFRDINCKIVSQNTFQFPITAFAEKIIHLKFTNFKNSDDTTLTSQSLSIFLTMAYQSGKKIIGSIGPLTFKLTPFSLQNYSIKYTSNNHGNVQIIFSALQEIDKTSKIEVDFSEMQGTPSVNVATKVLLDNVDKTSEFTIAVHSINKLRFQRGSNIPIGTQVALQLSQQNLQKKTPLQYNLNLCIVTTSSTKCHSKLQWQSFQSSVTFQNPLAGKTQNRLTLKLSSIRVDSSILYLSISNDPGFQFKNINCQGSTFQCSYDFPNRKIKIQPLRYLNQNNHEIVLENFNNPQNSISISNLLPKIRLLIILGSIPKYQSDYKHGVILAHQLNQRYCGEKCQNCMDQPNICQSCYPQKTTQYPLFNKQTYSCTNNCGSFYAQGDTVKSYTQNCPSCNGEKCSNCVAENYVNNCFRCSDAEYFLFNGSCIQGCQSNFIGDNASNCLALLTQCNAKNCQHCQEYSSQICGKCKRGFYLFGNGQCITAQNCPSGFYINTAQKSCLPCQSKCSSCKGNADFCTSCSQIFIRSKLNKALGQCEGQDYAVQMWYTNGTASSSLANKNKFQLLSDFFKSNKLDRLWKSRRMMRFLQKFANQQSSQFDQVEATQYLEMQYNGIKSSSEVLYSQLTSNFNRIFQLTLNHYLRNSKVSTKFKTYYFNLLMTISQFDRVVTLLNEDNSQDIKESIYTSINLIKDEAPFSMQNTLKPSDLILQGSFNTLQITTQSSQYMPVLSRILHLNKKDILEFGKNLEIYTDYALSVITNSKPVKAVAKFTINKEISAQQRQQMRCVGIDFRHQTLKYMPECKIQVSQKVATCKCSSEFNFLTVGYSLDAQSPDQIKNLLKNGGNNQISPSRLLDLIRRSITEDMVPDEIDEFLAFAQQQANSIQQKQRIQDKIIQIGSHVASLKNITSSNSQKTLALINLVIKQTSPESMQNARSFLALVQSLSLTSPLDYDDDSFSIKRYQLIDQKSLEIEINSIDGNKVTLPDSVKDAYPQIAQIVVVHFKQKNLYSQAAKGLYSVEQYSIITGVFQIRALDKNKNSIIINSLKQPIEIQFTILNAEDLQSNVKRQCMAWDGQINSPLSTQGCKSKSISRKSIRCSCNHLTYFSAALDREGGEEQFTSQSSQLYPLQNGIIASLLLILISFMVGIIAECRDRWNIDETKVLSDKKRKWTDPLQWFCPCFLFRNEGSKRRARPPQSAQQSLKNGQRQINQKNQYSSPKKSNENKKQSSSQGREQNKKQMSPVSRFFSFQTQPITKEEARKVLLPYSKQPYKFNNFFKYSYLVTSSIIGPFYGFDKFSSRVAKSSWLMIKITILLAISMLLFINLGADMEYLLIYTLVISLFHLPYSFYGRCYLARKVPQLNEGELPKRQKQYAEQAELRDVIAQIPRLSEREVAAGVIGETTTRSDQPTTMRQILTDNRLHYKLQADRGQVDKRQQNLKIITNPVLNTPEKSKTKQQGVTRDQEFDGAFGNVNWSPEKKKKRKNIHQYQESYKIRCSKFTIVALILSLLYIGGLCVIAVMFTDLSDVTVNGHKRQSVLAWILINISGLIFGAFVLGTVKVLIGAATMNAIGEKQRTKCRSIIKSVFVVRQIEQIYYEMEHHDEKGQGIQAEI